MATLIALSREEIGGLYQNLMDEVRMRLEAVQASLQEAKESPNSGDNWRNADFCYLQTRKVCELTATAVLLAHSEYEEFHSPKLLAEWNAHALFQKLLSLNQNAFPIAAEMQIDANGPGVHHLNTFRDRLSANELSEIYHQAADRLHVGSLKRILKGSHPKLDIGELILWQNKLTQLLATHIILLPEIRSVMVVSLKDQQSGTAKCIFGDGDGPAVLVEGKNVIDFQIDEEHA